MKPNKKNIFVSAFLILFFASASAALAQVNTRAPDAPPRGRPQAPQTPAPAPATPQTPPGGVALEYSQFYQDTHSQCFNLTHKLGREKGLPDLYEYHNYVDLCMESLFQCQENNSKCSTTVHSDGRKWAVCEKPLEASCLVEAAELIDALLTKMEPVKRYASDLSKAGCGNFVTEIDEDCDEGDPLGSASCPAGCKKLPPPVVVVPPVNAAPSPLPVVISQGNLNPPAVSALIPQANAGTPDEALVGGCQLAGASASLNPTGMMGVLIGSGVGLFGFRWNRRRKS